MLASRSVFVLSLVRHDSHFVETVISMSRVFRRSAAFPHRKELLVIGLKRLEQVVKVSDVVPSVEPRCISLSEPKAALVTRWRNQTEPRDAMDAFSILLSSIVPSQYDFPQPPSQRHNREAEG